MILLRRWAVAVLLAALMALFLSCGNGKGSPEPEGGITETGPVIPSRVVSLSPNITEIIYAIDSGDLLVGVTSFCDYPPEAKDKPRVGGVMDTNYEMILSLKPDIVIDLESQAERISKLEKLGLRTFVVANETIDDVVLAIDDIGALLGKEGKALEVKIDLVGNLVEVVNSVTGLERPTVAFVSDHSPGALQDVIVAGSGNFIDETLNLAGGTNVFADIRAGYPFVDLEMLLKFDPDFIFDATEKGEDVYSEITHLKAVREGNVFFCYDSIVQIPGPRLFVTVEYFARSMHPDAFAE